ncbi:MAG: hypothetical protein SFU86_13410 [Pirellulaceae bacterium]|nr:hypothetical protein [Pirellulaceae bacterium]
MSASEIAVLSVSCPGGMARQFRVQVRDVTLPNRWRQMGSFRKLSDARRLADQLTHSGLPARVVDCRALPTAA